MNVRIVSRNKPLLLYPCSSYIVLLMLNSLSSCCSFIK